MFEYERQDRADRIAGFNFMPILKKTGSFLAKRKTNDIVFRLDVAGVTRADTALAGILAATVLSLILPMPFFAFNILPLVCLKPLCL